MEVHSQFLKHESCPKCHSRNNLGVWSDGHKWCFGCGHYEAPTGYSYEYVRRVLLSDRKAPAPLQLPPDASFTIPEEARMWLLKYFIIKEDIVEHNIRYSEQEKALIFQVRNPTHELIFYQMRLFRPGPKYLTKGSLGDHLPVIKMSQDYLDPVSKLVIVEDYISAIRVSEWMDAMPLFGSHLNKKTATRLSHLYNDIYIWLDKDKAKEAMKFKKEYEALFDKCNVVITDLDPKEYPSNDIYDYLVDSEIDIQQIA